MSQCIFKMSSCGSNVAMEMSVPLVDGIITPTHTSVRCLKSFPSCAFSDRLDAQLF